MKERQANFCLVSIRALTWSAIFCDLDCDRHACLFQSAHPRGMRSLRDLCQIRPHSFNPRDFGEPRSRHPCLPT